MPMWCPPTPPSSEGDVYCDSWARALYRPGAAADALLPPVRWRERAPRSPRRSRPPARAPAAPPSLFERSGPRARTRRPAPAPQHVAPPPDWAPHEDAALRRALRLQRLPPEPPAAHAPNWDWLADLVADAARAYRSPRACRDRHDALADPDRARRKHRPKPLPRRRPDDETPRPPLQRIDAMRDAAERRRAAPKRRLDDASHHNPKHAALLADHGVDYDAPPTPMEVATRRAERIAKEKLKAGASAAAGVPASTAPAAVSGAGPGTPTPQRIVVAAGGGAGAGETRRPRPDAPLLYRQQALAARHHLKILHHPSPPQGGASVASIDGGGAGGAGGALRSLQLQQLALRRARPPHHVVLAHLAPAPSAAPTSTAPPAPPAPTVPPAAQHAPDPPQ